MSAIAKQTVNGKAFEYALLRSFRERLSNVTTVVVVDDDPYMTAQKCFESITSEKQDHDRRSADKAVDFLIDIEPRLTHGLNESDVLQLEIAADREGQAGDVRDVLAVRSLQKWEIGISAKNNHHAVKHPRLSNTIDFGERWVGIPCSAEYFSCIRSVFDELSQLRDQSGATKTWASLGDYHTNVYKPILDAFRDELIRLDSENPGVVASRLVEYLIGNKDFYKVIKTSGKVEVQAYNIHETLSLPFGNVKPKQRIPKLKLPDRLVEVAYKEGSASTLNVIMNEGWQISFRIHNASSRVEPSLKFDINLASAPHTLFVNNMFL